MKINKKNLKKNLKISKIFRKIFKSLSLFFELFTPRAGTYPNSWEPYNPPSQQVPTLLDVWMTHLNYPEPWGERKKDINYHSGVVYPK